MSKIRILMADDHPIFRTGMRALLEEQDDFEVIDSVDDGREAVELATREAPDVLLLDIELPGLSGVGVAQELARRNLGTKILVLSAFDDEAYISGLMAKGIAGYLTKGEAGSTVVEAIRQVARGQDGWLSQTIRSKLMALHRPRPPVLLSHRETEVLRSMAQGSSNKEIARALGISVHTVRNHTANIYSKLGVHSRTEALFKVRNEGLEQLAGSPAPENP